MKALILLAALPAREADSVSIDKAAYYLALEGTTRYGLNEAVKAILKGVLGHSFFPSPVEIRQQCDKAMSWHERERVRISRQEQIRRETPPDIPPRTPEEKARVAAIMARFNAAFEREKHREIETERAEIRARYGMTEERLAAIKDQPLPAGMVQLGDVKPAA